MFVNNYNYVIIDNLLMFPVHAYPGAPVTNLMLFIFQILHGQLSSQLSRRHKPHYSVMSGEQEPEAKKRKRGDLREKEKPNNEEAEVLDVVISEEKKEETEEKREEREAAWAEAELLKLEKKEKPEQRKSRLEAKKAALLEASQKSPDPATYVYSAADDPDNYQALGSRETENIFGRFQPRTAEIGELVKGKLMPPGQDSMMGESVLVVYTEGGSRVGMYNGGEDGEVDDIRPGEMRLHGDRREGRSENVVTMAVALKMEKKRTEKWGKMEVDNKKREARKLQVEAYDLARGLDRSKLSLDELTTLRQLEVRLWVGYGQSPVTGLGQRMVLDTSWEFVSTVYNDFLSLFPYCYAYWRRCSDIERKAENWSWALVILHRGLTATPLLVDLWIIDPELYHYMYSIHEQFPTLFREQCEKAVVTEGMEYRSDVLWELFIEKEMVELRFVTDLLMIVEAMPTELYNKHWNNFIAHVRDPIMCPNVARKVELPEDKLKVRMKERLLASLVAIHEHSEMRLDEIYR